MNAMTSALGNMGFRGPAGNYKDRSAGGDIIPKGYKAGQLQQFTPEQMELLSHMMGFVGPESYLSRLAGGDEEFFKQMEQPAWRQFQESQGQLGSRYSQLAPGAMGSQRSSGFQQSMGQLGSDFAMNLAANRQNLQRQAIQDMMQYAQMLMGQRPYERFLTEKPEKKALGGWGSAAGGILGGLGGFFLGGSEGAFKGAKIGSQAFQGM